MSPLPRPARTTAWPHAVDDVLAGDQAVALAHVTPASGVVLTPLNNYGLRDREAGAVAPLSSSVGMWRKLDRIQKSPRVAVAFHTREHGFSDRPEYVLVQGYASRSPLSDRGWVDRNLEAWERSSGTRDVGPLWERWLRIYHWRVGIEVALERLIVWPDLGCRGVAMVYGAALPTEPPQPHSPPRKGTSPRVDHVRAARRVSQRPNRLLGWVDADGFPMVVPVEVAGTEEGGILLDAPEGVLPPGGRRAGLLAHSFARYTFGQHKHQHTGWLEVWAHGDRALYSPHTEHGYHLPRSRFLYRLGAGFVTRRGYREGRRAGFLP
jgi:hypothetical protein